MQLSPLVLVGIGASILQKAAIRVINQTMCNTLLADQITSRMICVGILTGGIDACQVGASGFGRDLTKLC